MAAVGVVDDVGLLARRRLRIAAVFRCPIVLAWCRRLQDMRAMLDELMGPNRNGDRPDAVITDFRDEALCRNYMCGFCIHEQFDNSKKSVGPCPKIHNEELKKQCVPCCVYVATCLPGPVPAAEGGRSSRELALCSALWNAAARASLCPCRVRAAHSAGCCENVRPPCAASLHAGCMPVSRVTVRPCVSRSR
jgi:hypothetical protein